MEREGKRSRHTCALSFCAVKFLKNSLISCDIAKNKEKESGKGRKNK